MEVREKLKRLKKCSIILVPLALGLGILSAQFLRMQTPAGRIIAMIILVMGIPTLLFLMIRAYRDLCLIQKNMEEKHK